MSPFSDGADRRKAVRMLCGSSTSGRVTGAQGETQDVVAVLDLSTAGARFVLRHRIEPGTVIRLDLTNPLSGYQSSASTRVVHVGEVPDGNFILGGSFARELGREEVQELL